MNGYENTFELLLDDSVIEWLLEYGKSLNPKPREAYRKLLAAYFEYLKARYEDSKPSEPPQAEGE